HSIENGLALNDMKFADADFKPQGRLYLQTQILNNRLPASLPGKNADNTILETTLSLQSSKTDTIITLVSKDINLRIKARVLGIHTEDYYNDKVLDDADLLYTGILKLPDDFWQKNADNLSSWQKNKNTYYKMASKPNADCYPYQCLYTDDEKKFEAIVESIH